MREFAFTESIGIDAAAETVWAALQDIEAWWPASNPEHESPELLDAPPIAVGSRMRIRERVAGVPGEALGVITALQPGREVTWAAKHAHYRWLLHTVTVGEGVTWRVEPGARTEALSRRRWGARFPPTRVGTVLGWAFEHLLDGISKDRRRHARAELDYLKRVIESS